MSESRNEPSTPRKSAGKRLLVGFVLGLAADVTLFLWLRSGPLIYRPADRGERHYTDDVYLSDVYPRAWSGLAFILAVAVVGAVLTAKRRTRRVGEPLLFIAIAGAVLLSCGIMYFVTAL